MVKRDYLVGILDEYLDGSPEWFDGEISPRYKDGKIKPGVFNIPFELYGHDDIACISFKTGLGMRRQTNVLHGKGNLSMKLPYWGHVSSIRKEYLGQES